MTQSIDLSTLAARLDALLEHAATPDYPAALNGVQLGHHGPVRKIAAAVDFSRRTVEGAVGAGANLLLVHHGMFWNGAQPIVGASLERLRLLLDHDVAVYASHLPLDRHPSLGNNPLFARALGLEPSGEFARYRSIAVGVRGESDVETQALVDRARAFARAEGGDVVATVTAPGRRTRRWGLCTGSGASPETLAEAASLGLDTLIVGEGPHYTAVAAEDAGLAIIYAGHYATETLGVRALAGWVEREFGVPWEFVAAPTGL